MTAHPADTMRQAVALWCNEGLSQYKIALAIGCRKPAVRRWLIADLGQTEYDRLCQARTGKTAQQLAAAARKSHAPKVEVARKETKATKARKAKVVLPVEIEDEDEPEDETPTGCCRKCGYLLAEVVSDNPPCDGICGGCQEIAERIARLRSEGKIDDALWPDA